MNVTKDSPVFIIGEEAIADRVLENAIGEYRKTASRRDGTTEPAPTALQVAAVLKALSDVTLNQRMLDDSVKALGEVKISDPVWRDADGLAHFINVIAESIEENAKNGRYEKADAE